MSPPANLASDISAYHSLPLLPTNPDLADLGADEDEELEAAVAAATSTKKSTKKVPLTNHEALTFAPRGIYFDFATDQLRCSCNHKACDNWASYSFTRHFGFKCHKKYEAERLDNYETARLREARATYIRMNPYVQEQSTRKRKKKKDDDERIILTVEERRTQERHWMEMWKDAKNELKQLRQDLKGEMDEEVRAELMADIAGIKKRKGDWARLLGLNEAPPAPVAPITF